ncbi:MAG: bifunctional oligoribonuclease/PAP phosphatase NrnA [Clostridia bacterium]|nr:bifunctional oligoribonuclease/PAP phosphatase NrnA [Clostridia bacterium]
MDCTLEKIADRIKQAKSVAIFTHMRPDGDAFGSSLALSKALDFLKIPNQVCVETDIPANLAFIEGIENVKKYPEGNVDLLISVDCSDEQRLGLLSDVWKNIARKTDTINVDHHISNPKYAKLNYVRNCSSNCMNVAKLIKALGAPIDQQTAEYLLIGVLTDSGNFAHDDVTEETLALAAELVRAGADIRYYHYVLFKKQSKARAALHGKVMSDIRYFHDDRLAVISITEERMRSVEADPSMTEGFVDFPLNVDSVEVAASIMEVKKRQYKISLRSKTYADVNKIAGVYGGGGHVRAAGCMLFGELEEVIDKLSYTVSQYLE